MFHTGKTIYIFQLYFHWGGVVVVWTKVIKKYANKCTINLPNLKTFATNKKRFFGEKKKLQSGN